MTRNEDREAWGRFWEAAHGKSGSGCLPNALEQIDAAQSSFWHDFARRLPKRARVLDLATGDGVVLGKMFRARPDLRLIGADSSPSLPPSPRQFTLKAGVPMERLTFSTDSFDAITSQFGFEYGDTAAASVEVARVLKPGGALGFVVHHRSGPILAHNLPRRQALLWATSKGGYLPKARALVAARAKFPIPTPTPFHRAPSEARGLFPGQSVAVEFVTAILQTLVLSEGKSAREALKVLEALEDKAANEIARISSLDRSARDEQQIARVLNQLRSAGLEIMPPRELWDEKSGLPFAWAITGAAPGR